MNSASELEVVLEYSVAHRRNSFREVSKLWNAVLTRDCGTKPCLLPKFNSPAAKWILVPRDYGVYFCDVVDERCVYREPNEEESQKLARDFEIRSYFELDGTPSGARNWLGIAEAIKFGRPPLAPVPFSRPSRQRRPSTTRVDVPDLGDPECLVVLQDFLWLGVREVVVVHNEETIRQQV